MSTSPTFIQPPNTLSNQLFSNLVNPGSGGTSSGNSGYSYLTPDLLNQFNSMYPGMDAGGAGRLDTVVGQNVESFKSQFENLVGRAPTQDEISKFTSNYIAPNLSHLTDANSLQRQNPDSYVQQFVGNNFHKAAQDYATQQLQDQQTQANSLADLFRTQGNSAIDATQQSLLDYQSKLFDRLRPNLLTSLKSQGLLDTGGLNEAVAGVQGDLANNASNYIAGLKFNNEQGANQIAFGGASAPYLYKQSQITGQPDYLSGSSNGATNFNNSTFMSNLDYGHQLGLIQAQANAQAGLQPSFLRTFGQSFANQAGNQAAQAGGQLIKPSSYMTGFGG